MVAGFISGPAVGFAAEGNGLDISPAGLVVFHGTDAEVQSMTVFGRLVAAGGALEILPGEKADISIKDPPVSAAVREQAVKKMMGQSIDYAPGLGAASVDMIVPGGIVIAGKTIGIGESFTFDLPMQRFMATRDVSALLVRCTYKVARIDGDAVWFEVVPDARFPAKHRYLKFQLGRR